jgi:predicted CoA-binding protein
MTTHPQSVGRFLESARIAVAGVSRKADVAANAVYRKLRESGYDVVPVNPHADRVEGDECYHDIGAVPGDLGGVVIATHSRDSASVVRQCADRGVKMVWFHRSVGAGSVSEEAIDEAGRSNIECIVGGCPLMFCEPVDIAHRCMRWWLQRTGKVPR